MTSSQSQGGITNTYGLDASLRQRERITTGGSEEGVEIYHYASPSDSTAWVEVIKEGKTTWTRDIAGLGGGLGAIETSTGEVTLQLSDMHGDVVATAEDDPEAAKPLATQRFDEFGNPLQSGSLIGGTTEYGWLGGKARRTQLPSGIIQMGLRSYVPSLGRFLTPDPVQGGSANAYDYADQDPVNSFDLTGECSRRSRSCARRNAAKLNHRSRRTARSHGLQRLARRGGGARASLSLPSPGLAFKLGKDVAGKVGSTAGGLASAAFKFVRHAAEKSPQFVTAREIVTHAMAGMEAAYSWAADHQEQIYSCMYGAAEGFIYNRYLLIGGEAGAGALGLYMAVKCGVAFVG